MEIIIPEPPKITPVQITYQNYPEDRLPKIGVYYIFPKYLDKGFCQEFSLNLEEFLKSGTENIAKGLDYEFAAEHHLLSNAERHHTQVIRTSVPDGINFQTISLLIAQIHFQDFAKRYDWLKRK